MVINIPMKPLLSVYIYWGILTTEMYKLNLLWCFPYIVDVKRWRSVNLSNVYVLRYNLILYGLVANYSSFYLDFSITFLCNDDARRASYKHRFSPKNHKKNMCNSYPFSKSSFAFCQNVSKEIIQGFQAVSFYYVLIE